MLGRTHMMLGALVGVVMTANAPGLGMLEGAAIGAIAGLMPDLDHPNSTLTRKVAPISLGSRKISLALIALGVIKLAWDGWLPWHQVGMIALWALIAALSPHRGITHSLIGLLFATYGLMGWLGPLWTVFAAAYLSHLVADMLTDGGVPLLWPWKFDFHIPTGLHTGRFFTRMIEKGIQLVASLAIVGGLILHFNDFVRLALSQVQHLQKIF
ncbi:metal-dependent hydrolase [Collibacillus ludicampi]|uniref:Metal-dependent hydrolase n=1 Tax=Collibacillus ludicampi TaxID=2771369 RepID=A0AAV4LLR6_9BACL|nr:metal-dependent hydrolase [Collibacillus ludicampi]GIM48520.1 metal-dependent hydrolase [Collibacillus ludicampi]